MSDQDSVKGRTIRVFLAEGMPTGVLTAEIMNWMGHIVCGPRAKLRELLERPEPSRTGIYLLTGQDGATGQTFAYVGESDSVADRLTSHNKDESKDFWEYTCLITSKDQNLTKAHVRYLEGRLISLIKKEGRAKLLNATEPDHELPESDKSDMEYFISQLIVLLPVLGFEFIRPTPTANQIKILQEKSEANSAIQFAGTQIDLGGLRQSTIRVRPTADGGSSPIFEMRTGEIAAKAMELDGQMVVLAGSQAWADESNSLGANVRRLRNQSKETGKLVPSEKPDILVFKENVAFSSPSAAAQAIAASSRNGRTDWANTATRQTYAAWQESQVATAAVQTRSGDIQSNQ